MKKVIYCFSGTGNSLNAARIIAKEIGGASIVSVKKDTVSDLAAEADVVGFICPVYEWDIPETMKDFAEKLTVSDKAILFETPEAYRNLDNAISRRLGLPDKRTRYHNPHIAAKDIMSQGEEVTTEQ